MESHFLFYRGNRVFYATTGKGTPLLLLHGYQADSSIWNELVPLLSKKYLVITPDFPGHGKSPLIQAVNNMEFLAEIVQSIILSQGIEGVSIVGHSMGGYVALTFADKFYKNIDNLILINSHPFADQMNKVFARNREAELIEQGKRRFLLRNFVKNNFLKENHKRLKQIIEWATNLALEQPKNGLLADLAGMMARTDKCHVFNKLRNPGQILLGSNDEEIPDYKFNDLLSGNINLDIIPNCGHMSILENPEYIAQRITSIVN